MNYKTSQEDFETFKEELTYWLGFFGLKTWEVSFYWNDKHIDNRATTEPEVGPRLCKFILTKSKWSYAPDETEIRRLAFHECCELLIAEMAHWAEERNPEGSWDDISHRFIRIMENSVFTLRLDTIENSDKLSTSQQFGRTE